MNQMAKQVSDTFSKKVERAVCPAGKPYVYIMDMREKGLGVQVTARGTKSYIIRTQHQGRRICRVFASFDDLTLTEARRRAKYLIAQYLLGNDPPARPKPEKKKKEKEALTIRQIFDKWQIWAHERGESRSTIMSMMYGLQKFFDVEKKKAESLSLRDIENFRHARLKAGLKPSSVNRVITELKYLLEWAHSQELISDEFEFPRVKKLSEAFIEPKTDALSDVDVQKLLDATNTLVQNDSSKKFLQDFILFALNTGIRPASICGLEWRDILELNEDGGTVRLRAVNIKTRKEKILEISATAATIIIKKKQTLETPPKDTDKIFTTLLPKTMCDYIRRLMRSAGLAKFSAYSLRHTYATKLYEAGCSAAEIQIQMCHECFATTQKYIHPNKDHQKAVANRIAIRHVA